MTAIVEIKQKLIRLASEAAERDYEAATSLEADIHAVALRAIAAGSQEPAVLASEALRTFEVVFPRYRS